MTLANRSIPDEATMVRMEKDLFNRIDADEATRSAIVRNKRAKPHTYLRGPLIGVLATAAAVAIGTVAVLQPFGAAKPHIPVATAPPQAPDLFVADTGVENAPRMESSADWSFNVNDPIALRDFSTAVVSGKVVDIERSYVDGNGLISTAYSVRVETVFKGENVADVISVSLPGGTVTLGEYTKSLDELGRYEMRFGKEDPELRREAGLDPKEGYDPRKEDPSTAVTENWGVNPASISTVRALQPDSWVFYIVADGETYYGAAFDHALSYLKDGQVYSLSPEAERSPMPEDELFEK